MQLISSEAPGGLQDMAESMPGLRKGLSGATGGQGGKYLAHHPSLGFRELGDVSSSQKVKLQGPHKTNM